MKAKRKSDGKIIEVVAHPTWNKEIAYTCEGIFYRACDLDFDVEEAEQTESAVISGWVARNKDNSLYLFKAEPWYNKPRGYWNDPIMALGSFSISPELFPTITFSNSPQEVDITIKTKKK